MATNQIEKAAVIGAGVMGRGIAAHLANARLEVELLDIVPPEAGEEEDPDDPEFRNKLAREAIEQMPNDKPLSAVYTERDLDLIRPGNVEDHLDRLGDVDWVVEAVPEDLEIKRDTYDKVEEHVADDAIISSNTSGLSVADIVEGRSDEFEERFLVTHFFNPVRVMKLLELVPAEGTDPEVVDTIEDFGRDELGKGIVFGKDTTNFIANRIGVHGMMTIIHEMPEYDMTIEEVDQIFAEPLARASSAVFKTADIVGLDTFVHVADNCYESLTDDEDREVFEVPDYMRRLVEEGWTGRKAGKGFYEKVDEGILALRPDEFEYELRDKTDFDSLEAADGSPEERVRAVVVEGDDRAAAFAREVTLKTLAYTARRLGEIADDVVNIDRGMRWGFNWELGPFQTWDAIGLEWGVEQMKDQGIEVPDWVDEMVEAGAEAFYKESGGTELYWDPTENDYVPVPTDERSIEIADLKEQDGTIESNSSASLVDMGDGVACVEFHSKANSIDPDIIDMLDQGIEFVEENDWNGLVIGNDDEHFSVGANIMLVFMNAQQGQWEPIEQMVERFQQVNQRLRYSNKPVVTAPHGRTLGGGAEVAMAGNAIQAAGDTFMGLVEVGVGLIPGGSGNLQLLRNVYGPHSEDDDFDPLSFIQQVFMQIGMGEVERSAEKAREAGFLTANDRVTLNADHVLYRAKQRVLGMANSDFSPPRKRKYRLPGEDGIATIDSMLYNFEQSGEITAYDRHIGKKLARVLCGGETSKSALVSEEKLLELEREAFLSLCGEEKTQDRLQHMIQHNKPLRN
ncbi:MAG: 3-hydroxyacyl-CoA dehydrogenase NAD-binding domain-containing protein [Bradymonadaceae bacterium]